jgi:hypothetical protein
MTTFLRKLMAVALTGSLLVPAFALAQSAGVDAALQAQVTGAKVDVSASTTISAAVMTRAKTKADNEVKRRAEALENLLARINSTTKITAELKTSITTNINNQISALGALNEKIQADTDGATLKSDVALITQGYRVFALLMPQARIAAAADREATLVNMLGELGGKLQARLQAAAAAGADVSALNTALTDLGAKLQSAQAHAATAITTSATLTPDQGDSAKMKSNSDALKAARAEIVAAQKDITDARKDTDTIIKGLKTLEVDSSASGSAQTQ